MDMNTVTDILQLTQSRQIGIKLSQKKDLKKIIGEIAEVAGFIWDKGWAERNAGNISVNVTHLVSPSDLSKLPAYPFIPLPREYPGLGQMVFLVSGTGTRMRDIKRKPLQNLCFVYISETGSAYHIIGMSDEPAQIKPTSELAIHLAIHQMLIARNRPEKAVVHTHSTELVALTHTPDFCSREAINSILWKMHPEALMYIPEGVGFVPFARSGTESLAQATVKALDGHNAAVWEKHGCMALGNSVDQAFDTIDILAKSARIWFICKSAGFEPQGLTGDQMKEMREL
jgi:rhamnulose-1-phosphate aldolase